MSCNRCAANPCKREFLKIASGSLTTRNNVIEFLEDKRGRKYKIIS